jgi:peptidoglycan/LPS O-acetylase OafA/YrhL
LAAVTSAPIICGLDGSTMMAPFRPAPEPGRLAPLDVVRGMTILWITLFHFYIDTRGAVVLDAGPAAFLAAAGRSDIAGAARVAARAFVGIPGYRLDVFLFLSGLVLSLGRPLPAPEFYRRRARAILPTYWLGSLAAFLLLAGLAALRTEFLGGGFLEQLHGGTLLAHAPYRFEWRDLLRSASILGRFEDPRAMQVVAPSLWYVVLLGQFYLVFPLLRTALRRLGPWWFLATAAAITWGGRAIAFHVVLPGFDATQTVTCFVPFRLLAPAAGMVVALGADGLARLPRGPLLWVLSPVAGGCLLVAAWISLDVNTPGTWLGVVGGALPLAVSLPALWSLASVAAGVRPLRDLLTWTGRHSLSLLVVQDFLRLGVGTLLSARGDLADLTWPLMPAYLGLALVLTRAWHPLPQAVGDRVWSSFPLGAIGLSPRSERSPAG